MLWSGRMVTGSTIIPASLRLTLSTSSAWASMGRFLWTMPIPPSWASAMARRDSVTVSIAAERIGMFMAMPRLSWVLRSTSLGWTWEKPGTIETSSKVRARRGSVSFITPMGSSCEGVQAFEWTERISRRGGPHPRPTNTDGHGRTRTSPNSPEPRPCSSVERPCPSVLKPYPTLPHRHRRPVALLVLLAGAAGAGVIAPHLVLGDRLRRLAGALRLGGGAGELDLRRRHPFPAAALLGHLLLGHRLVAEEALDDVVLHPLAHRLEELIALLLVLLERIALAVAAQADALLQVVEGQQVVLPGDVHGVEHDRPLEAADDLGLVPGLLVGVARLQRLVQPGAQLLQAHLLQVGRELLAAEVEIGEQLGAQAGEVPIARIVLVRTVGGEQGVDDVRGDPHDVVAPLPPLQGIPAQLVDRLPLLVHHVVVFEQVLAGLEVPPLDLLLGPLDRLAHHVVLDRLALLHAQPAHDPLDAVGAEDAHEVVFERQVEARGAGIALTAE